jgi:murein DD-endopeptidase MepM/ murein hydrolase activator NlpD
VAQAAHEGAAVTPYRHPTTGKPPHATNGYDFFDLSGYSGEQHRGWDVGEKDHPINGIAIGKVLAEGLESTMGYFLYELLSNGELIRYLHMRERSTLRVGQVVTQASLIGYVGMTGKADGSHLHFDMSFGTMAEALAEAKRFGGTIKDVSWRESNRRAYVNPAILIDKSIGEDEMDTIIILTTKGGPAQYIYKWETDRAQHLSWPGLVAINAAEGQGKVAVARVELTDEHIAAIGKELT